MDLYPKDMDAETFADLSLRRMFCDFLCACLIIVIARSEDVIEAQVCIKLSPAESILTFAAAILLEPAVTCEGVPEPTFFSTWQIRGRSEGRPKTQV